MEHIEVESIEIEGLSDERLEYLDNVNINEWAEQKFVVTMVVDEEKLKRASAMCKQLGWS